MDDVPSQKKLEALFKKYSEESDTLDHVQFKNLCYKLYLSPTQTSITDLFHELDKNDDDQLSFEEMETLVKKQWTPLGERKQSFLDDLHRCMKNEGPLHREELKDILQQGDEALSDEDVDFCLDRMDLNGDSIITCEEISEFIYQMDADSRATSRATSRCQSGRSRKSRSSSSSSDSKHSGSGKRESSAGSHHSESHNENTQDDNEITTTETENTEAENAEEKTSEDQTIEAAPEVEDNSQNVTDETPQEEKTEEPSDQNDDNNTKSEENKDEPKAEDNHKDEPKAEDNQQTETKEE